MCSVRKGRVEGNLVDLPQHSWWWIAISIAGEGWCVSISMGEGECVCGGGELRRGNVGCGRVW